MTRRSHGRSNSSILISHKTPHLLLICNDYCLIIQYVAKDTMQNKQAHGKQQIENVKFALKKATLPMILLGVVTSVQKVQPLLKKAVAVHQAVLGNVWEVREFDYP